MPTYGYECTKCGHQFEVFQSITAAPVTKCESCGGKVQQMVFPVGIHFKGEGFHINDYAKNAGTSESSTPSEPSEPSPSSKKDTPSPDPQSAPGTP